MFQKIVTLSWPRTNPQLKQYSVKQSVQAAGMVPPVFFMIAQARQVGYSASLFCVAIRLPFAIMPAQHVNHLICQFWTKCECQEGAGNTYLSSRQAGTAAWR